MDSILTQCRPHIAPQQCLIHAPQENLGVVTTDIVKRQTASAYTAEATNAFSRTSILRVSRVTGEWRSD
jgi:hypothetical protein